MLTLSLYPVEFVAMVAFLGRVTRDQIDVPLTQQPVAICVLMAFQAKLRLDQVFAWSQRDTRRAYKYRLPVTVARALYQELQQQPINVDQQLLLDRLHLAIVDYRAPLSQRHIILSLPAYAYVHPTP